MLLIDIGFFTVGGVCLIDSTMGYLDAQTGDVGRTAFRKAEKFYKRYKHYSSGALPSKFREKVPSTDLSQVLDFKIIQDSHNCTSLHAVKQIEGQHDWPVFTLEQHPGFYFIPQALNVEEQMYWIQESLLNFPQPPNRTNHTTFYGHIYDLWTRAKNQEVLVCSNMYENGSNHGHGSCDGEDLVAWDNTDQGFVVKKASTSRTEHAVLSEKITPDKPSEEYSGDSVAKSTSTTEDSSSKDQNSCMFANKEDSTMKGTFVANTLSTKFLLRKLRWATLGLQFDWSKRTYDLTLPYRRIPSKLSYLASKLAEPALKKGNFHAEAAIINYFGPDDMLGGHLDDMEADWSKPIVSISLGCKAVFLLGGPSRDDPPTAMFLRSGDVVLMAGPARGCFHGVPRIFVDADSELPDFSENALFAPFLDYIKESRINMNIRQVH